MVVNRSHLPVSGTVLDLSPVSQAVLGREMESCGSCGLTQSQRVWVEVGTSWGYSTSGVHGQKVCPVHAGTGGYWSYVNRVQLRYQCKSGATVQLQAFCESDTLKAVTQGLGPHKHEMS